MKIFIWDRVEHVSENYHNEGGLVVCAETLDRAREIIKKATEEPEEKYASPVDAPCGALTDEPDKTVNGGEEEFIFIFPDAGCC